MHVMMLSSLLASLNDISCESIKLKNTTVIIVDCMYNIHMYVMMTIR